MAPDDKLVDTIKFLLTSVKKLSDTFVDSETKVKRGFDGVACDVDALRQRLEWLERHVEETAASNSEPASGAGAAAGLGVEASQLPVAEGTERFRVPVLNLPLETIVEVYANTPLLLEPFGRPCSLSGRTLSGEIDEVELEAFAQGSTWVVESQDEGCLLVPRPGSLERKTSLQSLERLYDIEGVRQLPVLLHLIEPARVEAVVVGRRWQLRQKGQLSVSPDPLRVGLSDRLASLEQRLSRLERQQGG
ncbi:MAG: hypothetical protein VKK97_07140 [Synechococcaceae cyanobacterium]|nr:hypothetical protein [Synechococcaceae cyanobacterium]